MTSSMLFTIQQDAWALPPGVIYHKSKFDFWYYETKILNKKWVQRVYLWFGSSRWTYLL